MVHRLNLINRIPNKYLNNFQSKIIFFFFDRIAVTIKLFLVMGLPWIFELLNKMFPKTWGMITIFDQITALQGVMIFSILVFKKKVMSGLRCEFGYSITRTPNVSAKSNMLQDNNFFFF